MKNNNRKINLHTQSLRFVAKVLLIVWLLTSVSPESVLATPKRQSTMVPATTPSALEGGIAGQSIVLASISADYAPYDGPKLSRIAAQVSQNAGFEGIKQLLTLLREQQEIVGLQHLLLQLRVVHEWLCIASEQDAAQGMAELEGAFKVMASLEQWFVKSFNHLRRGGSWHTGTGQKLLDLLKGSLQSFDSVAKHASDLFQLLKSTVEDESVAVRKAALLLLADPPAAWSSESSSIILELLKGPDSYAVRATLRMLLSLGKWYPAWTAKALNLIETDLKDSYAYVRKGALETLSTLAQVAPEQHEAALGIIQSALQDQEGSVRSAALGALSSLVQVASEQHEAALGIIQSALQDPDYRVCSAAFNAFSTLVQVAPEHAEAVLQSIQKVRNDGKDSVRSAALGVLSALIQVAPEQHEAALEIIQTALEDQEGSVRSAALGALSALIQAVPKHAEAALGIIQEVLKDGEDSIRLAAFGVLSILIQVAPGHFKPSWNVIRSKRTKVAFSLIQSAFEDQEGSVRSAALRALSSLVQIAPGHFKPFLNVIPSKRTKVAFSLIQSALQDVNGPVRSVALGTLSTLIQVAPDRAQAALGIIRSALQDKSQGVGEASFGAFSTLAKAASTQYQAVFENIQTALQDGPWRTCLAALKALVALVQVAPEQSEEVFKIIQKLLKDKDPDIREMTLGVLPKLVQVAPRWAQYALQLILSALQDTQGNVRKAAFRFMERSSLEQLLDCYWTTPDSRLIPYMTPRLYHTPLVVSNSVGDDDQQLILYLTGRTSCQWILPKPAIDRFVALVKDEASQMKPWILSEKIGQRVWEQYFGAVGEEPALPADIEEIMDSPCPFWEGQRVRDTHLLALIPSHVAGQPLTLDYLGKLIQSPKGEGHRTKYGWFPIRVEAIASQSPESSYWVLMTRDVLDESRDKSYQEQCALVARHQGYTVPGVLEAAVVMLLHHVRSGERLYSDHPSTYTRCRDKGRKQGDRVIIGNFSSQGLFVFYTCSYRIPYVDSYFNYNDYEYGVAGLRKF